jgi:hypothetical protein
MKRLQRVAILLRDLLREISDESAYQRHLTSRHRLHCRREWQQFQDQRLQSKFIRPKCC